MFFAAIILFIAIAISSVAGYFSIYGLVALFSGLAIPVAIMGIVLEIGKVASAAWLHNYWEFAPTKLKIYLTSAVVALMLLTSLGIFGFLSKGHLEQEAPLQNQQIQIDLLDDKIQRQQDLINSAKESIAREKASITNYQQTLDLFNKAYDTQVSSDQIDKGTKTRANQKKEIDELRKKITDATGRINEQETQISKAADSSGQLKQDKSQYSSKVAEVEAKLGPIKYVMELMGVKDSGQAVRAVIFLIMFAFDPVAIALIIASQWTFKYSREQKLKKLEAPKEVIVEPVPVVTPEVEITPIENIEPEIIPIDAGPEPEEMPENIKEIIQFLEKDPDFANGLRNMLVQEKEFTVSPVTATQEKPSVENVVDTIGHQPFKLKEDQSTKSISSKRDR